MQLLVELGIDFDRTETKTSRSQNEHCRKIQSDCAE